MECAACSADPHSLCLTHKLAYWREAGGLNISPAATPSRRNHVAPATPRNSWERGIPVDERGMPYLDHGMSPIGQKEWGHKWRRVHEDSARRRSNTPPPSS